jgi:hypothetical protein
MGKRDARSTVIALKEALPAEIPVGTSFGLAVRVSCQGGGTLPGGLVNIKDGNDIVATRELLVSGDDFTETEPIALTAPDQVGEYLWTAEFPKQEIDGVVYEQSALPILFKTKPHAMSLAVWDVPSPVVMGERFTVKVGAKSTADSPLQNAHVDVIDESGALVGSGTLGEEAWPGTAALFWAEVPLTAPSDERICSWSVRFAADELSLPHDSASGAFSFSTTPPPQHVVEITAVVKDTEAAIPDAIVRLGRHRGCTDDSGLVRLGVPKGTYDLIVWKAGYETTPTTLEVTRDVAIRVEGKELPPKIYMGIE